ncbi:hypothetical protein C8035_v002321 [Colletotrichum spinosum]|uniref:C2H2-type domain-containing protein n=1 Tax=Colletotrichum spinosum TaxID=1347390 RepID=A0A4R8PXS5_9PEZI|nr:hypothetical protein C8035_v002321 [Colletotrichum spinosum]
MPKKHQDLSPKSSSTTRTSPALAVRQAPGTQSNRPSRSRTVREGGGSEASAAINTSQSRPSDRRRVHRSTQSSIVPDTTSSRATHNLSAPAYVDGYLEYRKALFIKIFMEEVEEWLDQNLCPIEEAYDNDDQAPGGSKSSGVRGVKRAASAGKLKPELKRQNRGDDRDDDASDSEKRDDRDNAKRMKTTDDRKKFACPFFKEHLFRTHSLHPCSRCFVNFKTSQLLDDHVRAEVACTVRNPKHRKVDPAAGMSPEVAKKVRSRKQGKTNVEKWLDVYHVLFPDIDIGDLPSPYYDDPVGTNCGSKASNQYKHFLRRKIPDMIRQELEAESATFFKDVGLAMQGRLLTWIHTSAKKCAKIVEFIPSVEEAIAQGDPESRRSSRGPSPATAVEPPFESNGEAINYWPSDEPLDFSSIDFRFDLPDDMLMLEQCQTFGLGDSGYDSGSLGVSSGPWRV